MKRFGFWVKLRTFVPLRREKQRFNAESMEENLQFYGKNRTSVRREESRNVCAI